MHEALRTIQQCKKGKHQVVVVLLVKVRLQLFLVLCRLLLEGPENVDPLLELLLLLLGDLAVHDLLDPLALLVDEGVPVRDYLPHNLDVHLGTLLLPCALNLAFETL